MRDEIVCVDEGLSRADVATRHAREEARVAADAYARGEIAEARHAMEWVNRAREASRSAAAVADACFVDEAATKSASANGTQVRMVVAALPSENADAKR